MTDEEFIKEGNYWEIEYKPRFESNDKWTMFNKYISSLAPNLVKTALREMNKEYPAFDFRIWRVSEKEKELYD